MRQEGEPSVEEILESIKKVIARDNRELAQAERRRRMDQGVSATSESSFDPALAEEVDEVLDLAEAGRALDSEDDDGDSGLTTAGAADAMRQSLAALAMLAEPAARPQIVRQGETSLEGMVREMLRPMLAQWLDDNLPAMVERLVTAEIARIAGKKR